MRKSLFVINSLVGAALLTAVTAAGVLLYLMFSTGDEVVDKSGLFGALFFQTARIPGGGLGISMGVADASTLLICMGVVALLLAWVQVVFIGLRTYRNRLLEDQVSHR